MSARAFFLWLRFAVPGAPAFDIAMRYADAAHMARDAGIWRRVGASVVAMRSAPA